ncbi:hypothetical protein L3X38_036265 [Prunus dulcis]|uniref:Uncharacterized protein n=1 Tax=Prunus dulcis TaxID=3755 RepID=A0AAD4V280_PRUDU|nr:hypothetical protein L3X38_036265 [Prunus dulcis]
MGAGVRSGARLSKEPGLGLVSNGILKLELSWSAEWKFGAEVEGSFWFSKNLECAVRQARRVGVQQGSFGSVELCRGWSKGWTLSFSNIECEAAGGVECCPRRCRQLVLRRFGRGFWRGVFGSSWSESQVVSSARLGSSSDLDFEDPCRSARVIG